MDTPLPDTPPNTTPEQDKPIKPATKSLIGVKGWLLFFVIGLGIGALYNLVQLASYPSAFADIRSLEMTNPGLVNDLQNVLWFEVVQFSAAVITIITLIVLILQQKRVARTVAIGLMVGIVVLGTIDYIWASAVFAQYSLDVQSELAKAAGSVGRSVITAAIWIPYFLVSKRVKATLTK